MIVNAQNIYFNYEESNTNVLNNFALTIKQGEFVTLLGKNGSGKTTFIRHLNVLLKLQQGSLFVCNLNVNKKEHTPIIRQKVGMVFQNPDNQFVSSIVEEDISFTLENYSVPQEKITELVIDALKKVSMQGFEKENIQNLSGGQKQRIAIAGVLVAHPKLLIFDESTSMLDDEGRKEVLHVMKSLHTQGMTIILITHRIDEAIHSNRIAIVDEGKVVAFDSVNTILQNKMLLEKCGIEVPISVRLYYDLADKGIQLKTCPVTLDELEEALCKL